MTLPTAVLAALLVAGAAWWAVPQPTSTARAVTTTDSAVPGWVATGRERLLLRWNRFRSRRQASSRRATAVLELTEVLAAELRAGRPSPSALEAAVAGTAVDVVPGRVVASAWSGGPVADLLDSAAAVPGAAGLHGVAACWRVAEQSGAGLARGLEQVVAGLRDEQRVSREVAGQLAAPRATGRLLALLPAFGWLLGSGLGAAPLEVLLTRPVGWACLAVGVPLQVAGWWWMERLATSVQQGGP